MVSSKQIWMKTTFLIVLCATLALAEVNLQDKIDALDIESLNDNLLNSYPKLKNVTQAGINKCFASIDNPDSTFSAIFLPNGTIRDVVLEYFDFFTDFEPSAERVSNLLESVGHIIDHVAECSEFLKSDIKKVPTFKMGFTYMSSVNIQQHLGVLPFQGLMDKNNSDNSSNVIIGDCKMEYSIVNDTKFMWTDKYHKLADEVKNQGYCGSCYACVATGVLESALVVNDIEVWGPLAVQFIVDFDKKDEGCKGGSGDYAFEFIKEEGLPLESTYPYAAKRTRRKRVPTVARPESFCFMEGVIEEDRRIAYLKEFGPHWMTFKAGDPKFASYRGGRYEPPPNNDCGDNSSYHALLVVGFDSDSWYVRNSWSKTWGYKGFAQIARGVNACEADWQIGYMTV